MVLSRRDKLLLLLQTGIVKEHPLVIVVLFINYFDGLFLPGTANANDGATAGLRVAKCRSATPRIVVARESSTRAWRGGRGGRSRGRAEAGVGYDIQIPTPNLQDHFTLMNQAPIILAGHGIFVAL